MKKANVVIIGGSAAGLTAAITVRRHYPDTKIILIRKEKRVQIPCGIPYIFGTIGSAEKNMVPDTPLEQNNVELIVDEVTGIDRETKTITTKSGEEFGYEKLILATGSVPMVPAIPGRDKEDVFTVWKATEYLTHALERLKSAKKLVIIGGGFIGVEFADECNKIKGLDVTIVELLPHCLMLALDPEYCKAAEEALVARGVKVMTDRKVVSIEGDKKATGVKLEDGTILETDVVIIGIGALPHVEFAEKCDLKIGDTGSIWVDRTMHTSDPDILACGDCAEKYSFFGGKPSYLKLASIATAEARIAGSNIFLPHRESSGTIGVFSTVVGDKAFAMAGLTETNARSQGYDIVVGRAEGPNRHPGSMPGMVPQKVKLIFDRRTLVLLGAEMEGDNAVGELINAACAFILHKMTVDDIACFQIGTQPALTASPVSYQLVNAAESALMASKQ